MPAILLLALKKFIGKLVITLVGQELLEWMIFKIIEQIVKTTETKIDDEWFDKIKEAYFKKV